MAGAESFDDEAQLGLHLREPASARPAGFDFTAWAHAARFAVPDRASPTLERVASPAEAYVVRELFAIPSALYDGGDRVHYHGAAICVQVPAGGYRIDIVVQFEQIRLAVEIDG